MRIWSDKTGKFKTEARMIAIEVDKVVLKRSDGTIINVPIDKLSDADAEFVKNRGGAKR
jgi:hypothetical protein